MIVFEPAYFSQHFIQVCTLHENDFFPVNDLVVSFFGLQRTLHHQDGRQQGATAHQHRYVLGREHAGATVTLDPRPSTLASQPSSIAPRPSDLDPRSSTLHPRPSTLSHAIILLVIAPQKV